MLQKQTTIADHRPGLNIQTDRGLLKHLQRTLLRSAV